MRSQGFSCGLEYNSNSQEFHALSFLLDRSSSFLLKSVCRENFDFGFRVAYLNEDHLDNRFQTDVRSFQPGGAVHTKLRILSSGAFNYLNFGGFALLDFVSRTCPIRALRRTPSQHLWSNRSERNKLGSSRFEECIHLDPSGARLGDLLPVAQPFANGGLVVDALAVGVALALEGLGVEHPKQAALVPTAETRERSL
jgi:hypothetical protein